MANTKAVFAKALLYTQDNTTAERETAANIPREVFLFRVDDASQYKSTLSIDFIIIHFSALEVKSVRSLSN